MWTKLSHLSQLLHFRSLSRRKCSTCTGIYCSTCERRRKCRKRAGTFVTSHNEIVALVGKISDVCERNCPTYLICCFFVHFYDKNAALVTTFLFKHRTKLSHFSRQQHFRSLLRQECSTCHDIIFRNANEIVQLITTAAFLFIMSTKMQHLSRHFCSTCERNCPTYVNCSFFVRFVNKNAALVTTFLFDMRTKLSLLF